MSELVIKWLNKEVGLSKKVGAFERDFSNGYLYAEVLSRHGLVSPVDLEEYVDDASLQSKRGNFARLGAALASSGTAGALGIRLKEQQVAEIMDEDRGSSLRLLFQLKKGLEKAKMQSLGINMDATRKPDITAKIDRKMHGDHQERYFEQQLKNVPRIDRRVDHQLHIRKFADEHTQQMKATADHEANKKAELHGRQKDFRNTRLDTMDESRRKKEELRMDGEETGQATKVAMITAIERDLNFEKHTIKREIRKSDQIRERHRLDCGYGDDEKEGEEEGIGWFEKNMRRIGIDTSGEAGPGADYKEIDASNMKEMHEEMHKRLPHPAELQIESQKKMGKVKDAKTAYDQARKERANRQHRTMLEQRDNQARLSQTKMDQDLLAELQIEMQTYQKQARLCDLEMRHREAVWLERQERQRAYAERAARESEEAYQRQKEKCRAERDQMLADRADDAERTRMRNAQGLGATAKAALDDSSDEEGEQTSLLAQSKTKDMTMMASESDHDMPIAPAKELKSCVDDPRISSYLFSRGKWTHLAPPPKDARALAVGQQASSSSSWRPKLGCLVRWLLAPQPPGLEAAQLPAKLLPVIAIAGTPAGLDNRGTGMAVAKRIQKELEFAMVEPQKVVAEAIALSQKELTPEHPVLARIYKLGKTLAQAQSEQGESANVPAAVYAELIFRKIELLSAPPPKMDDEDNGGKAKAKSKAKGKAAPVEESEEPAVPKGVMVVGFPVDLQQQVAWEHAARAYSSPLLRTLDGDDSMQAQVSSILAPWQPAHETVGNDAYYKPQGVEVGLGGAPLHHLRLSYPAQEDIGDALVAEASNENAWASMKPVSIPNEEEGAAGVVASFCAGYEQELCQLTNPVDRAWLYDEMQRLSQAFLKPLSNSKEIVADKEEGDDGGVEAACRFAMEQIETWRAAATTDSDPADEAAQAEAAPADDLAAEAGAAGEAAEEAQPAAAAAQADVEVSDDEEDTVLKAAQAEGGQVAPEPWRAGLPEEKRSQMRTVWLATLSAYLTGLRETFGEVEAHTGQYGNELMKLQRGFLDFLQKEDNKLQILQDFFKSWSKQKAASMGRPVEKTTEELEELSDKLWQITDTRRSESIEELAHLQETSGFWEGQAGVIMSLTHKLQRVEMQRCRAATKLLRSAYAAGGAEEEDVDTEEPDFDSQREGVSSLDDLCQLLLRSTVELLGPMPDESIPAHPELRDALMAVRLEFATRLRTIESWCCELLRTMREQLDEVFRRSDDWIRDRIRVENDAIHASVAEVVAGPPSADPMSPGCSVMSGGITRTLSGSGKMINPSTSSSPLKRWRREVAKLLEPCTLDVDLYRPPPLEILAVQAAEKQSAEAAWSETMLKELMQTLLKRGRAAAREPGAVLEALLEQRSSAYKLESSSVPANWTKRSELALELFCNSLTSPSWGAVAVDVIEMLLTLALDTRGIIWPKQDSLLAARKMIEEAHEGTEDGAYPDVPVSKSLFMSLPLWAEAAAPRECIFEILSSFDDGVDVSLVKAGSISARRLFAYVGLGSTPYEGVQNMLAASLPPLTRKSEDSDGVVGVQDVWKILFSLESRPAGVGAVPRELEPFCRELVPPPPPPEENRAPTKGKKGEPPPPPPEPVPPPPPEEVVVSGDVTALAKHPAILRALSTHGALLCRKRGLQALFNVGNTSATPPPLQNAAELAALKPLASLVPVVPEEAAGEEAS